MNSVTNPESVNGITIQNSKVKSTHESFKSLHDVDMRSAEFSPKVELGSDHKPSPGNPRLRRSQSAKMPQQPPRLPLPKPVFDLNRVLE